MYVSRSEITVVAEQRDFIAANEAMHAAMRNMAGFRWAMLLRSLDNPEKLASVAMWLTRDQAEAWAESDSGMLHYDVATARGAMTPAAFAAIVDWQVDQAAGPDFVNRWNAAFHAIEDRLGSRLLQDLGQPESLRGPARRQQAGRPRAGGAGCRDCQRRSTPSAWRNRPLRSPLAHGALARPEDCRLSASLLVDRLSAYAAIDER